MFLAEGAPNMFEPFSEIYELALPYLDTRNNRIHMEVSRAFAVRLLQAEGGEPKVVLPAITLHDVGWKMVPEELHLKAFGPHDYDRAINRIHEVEGARIAGEILEKVGYDPALIAEIVEIISGHDSRETALSLNDAIVKDSDKLWRFSKEAAEIDPKRFNIDAKIHIPWLALQIEGWFITKTGKKIACEEQQLRAKALDQL
jgi:HD superfamily phosphodiesterase